MIYRQIKSIPKAGIIRLSGEMSKYCLCGNYNSDTLAMIDAKDAKELLMSATSNIVEVLLILNERQSISGIELEKRFSVDRRTIRNYISTLKEAGFPITSTKGRYSAYTLADNHVLAGLKLTQEEMEVLSTAEANLKLEKGYGHEAQFKTLLAKIKKQIHLLTEPASIPKADCTAQDPSRETNNAKMTIINKALKEYRKMEIVYNSGGKKEQTCRIIWPFGLYNANDENYLLAHCEKSDAIREFNIKRIKELHLLDGYYPKSQRISVKDYFQNAIGAFGGEAFPVKLLIEAPFDRTVQEKKLVKNQKTTVQENGSVLFEAKLSGRPDVVRWILAMGSHCKVLEPEDLREEIIQEAQRILDMYRI